MGALDMGLSEDISTHTLRKEGDLSADGWVGQYFKFQPTPSARRVTRSDSLPS